MRKNSKKRLILHNEKIKYLELHKKAIQELGSRTIVEDHTQAIIKLQNDIEDPVIEKAFIRLKMSI